MRTRAFLLGLIFMGPLAFGVSRVGGGKIGSPVDGFTATVPPTLSTRQIDSQTVQLLGGITGSMQGFRRLELQARTLRFVYPDLKSATRNEFRAFFIKAGWTETPNPNPCIEELLWNKNGSSAAVVSWGEDRGMIVVGAESMQAQWVIKELLSSIQLIPGACAWK